MNSALTNDEFCVKFILTCLEAHKFIESGVAPALCSSKWTQISRKTVAKQS